MPGAPKAHNEGGNAPAGQICMAPSLLVPLFSRVRLHEPFPCQCPLLCASTVVRQHHGVRGGGFICAGQCTSTPPPPLPSSTLDPPFKVLSLSGPQDSGRPPVRTSATHLPV